MKSKIVFIAVFLFSAHARGDTPRPIMASQIYNNLVSVSNPGYIGIPTTPILQNKACYIDANSTIQSSVTTSTELSYLSGATSNIQAQINAISGGAGGPRFTNTVSTGYSIPTLTVDAIINVNTSTGVIPIVLPDAVASRGWCVDVKVLGVNSVVTTTQSGQTIDGQSSDTILQEDDSKHYCAVGGEWFNY